MLVRSRRKSAPALCLESLEQRLGLSKTIFTFETPTNLFSNSFLTIQIFRNNPQPPVNIPSTPSVPAPVFSFVGFQQLILSDLIGSLSFAAQGATTSAAQSLANPAAAAASQSAAAGSAAARNIGSFLTSAAATVGADTLNRLGDAFGLLRTLTQNAASAVVPVNTQSQVNTANFNGYSALAGLIGALPGPKRTEPGHIYLGDLQADQDECLVPEMKWIPKAGAMPMNPLPLPAPEKTNPDKGTDNNPQAMPENKPELPALPTPAEEPAAKSSLSLSWVDPTTETSEMPRPWEGTESLRSYAATLTVALVINGWWNKPATPVLNERERRRLVLKRWPQ